MLQTSRTRDRCFRLALMIGLLTLAVAAGGATAAQQAQQAEGQERAEPESADKPKPPARLAVSPGKMEVEIGAKQTVHSMRLLNLGDRPISVKVTVAPWDLDEDNQVRILEPTEQSLDQWLVFNPRSFTIDARSEQTVRFSIRPRVQPVDGEHRAMIYFEEQQPEQGPRVQVRFRLGVAIYAYAGEVERRGVVNMIDIAADPQFMSASFDISSTGNAHVRLDGQYAVWAVDAFPGVASVALMADIDEPGFAPPAPMLSAGLLPTLPILPGTRRQMVMTGAHTLPPGRYVMGIVGTLAGESFKEMVEFTVPATAQGQIAGSQQ